MRIRTPFAGAFLVLCLAAAYLGLFPNPQGSTLLIDDKIAHGVTFFLLTLCFYWILDTTRRRAFNSTLLTCTLFLGIGSEVLQGILENDRVFSPYDIIANIVGSLCAIFLCGWYHKRMLERKRAAKHYHLVSGADGDIDLEAGLDDEETGEDDLGRGVELRSMSVGGQETEAPVPQQRSLEDEVENWDENADEPWEDGDGDESVVGEVSTVEHGAVKPSKTELGEGTEAESNDKAEAASA